MKKRNLWAGVVMGALVLVGAGYFVSQKMSADSVTQAQTPPYIVTITPDKITAVEGDIVTYKVSYKNIFDPTSTAKSVYRDRISSQPKSFQITAVLADGSTTGKQVVWSVDLPVYNQSNDMSVPVTIQYPKGNNTGRNKAFGTVTPSTPTTLKSIQLKSSVNVGSMQNRVVSSRMINQGPLTANCTITITPKPASS